ncbi:NADH dehydrogenase subunit 1 [Handroanthus impetiginosus]|uniref:NADH dehydrogenase subunit 1 n=1 Tax=Handroanthus impetiginosus TaxID=429701 RepID=A0A2G9FVI8_9LAMI|nr:NADH dehydrogenase subunit 1 [Handroanthus impetiginosus]
MIYSPTIISIIEVLLVSVPVLLTVAFVTVAERKTMASMQRRLGPNIVGYYGLLQAFADALKLLIKEYISPTQANLMLFFLGPIITLIFSLLGYAVVPYGSLRSTAQLISYELILSSAILLVILLTGSLNLTVNIEAQRSIWFLLPLFPVFVIFFIGSVAETNRAPFDLAEAESELVSGFMTEHAAVIFVFFFLAEYASIVLICILNAMLFFGGYLIDYTLIIASFPRIRFDQLMSFS